MKCQQCKTQYTNKDRYAKIHFKQNMGRHQIHSFCSIACIVLYLLGSNLEDAKLTLGYYHKKYKEDNQ